MAHEDTPAGMSAHISEDTLERYAMNQLPDAELAPVEEHLLVCTDCQDRLAGIDRFRADLDPDVSRRKIGASL